jgi:zinc protease
MKKTIFPFLLLTLLPAGLVQAQYYRPVFEKITLENGLSVILHRDTTLPVVSVNIAYHGGSAWDPKGKNGLATIAANMLLSALPAHAASELRRLEAADGVSYAGLTNVDWTNLACTYPANDLDAALWIEAERMSSAIDAVTPELVSGAVQYQLQKMVKDARQPLWDVQARLYAEVYPEGHPYRHVSSGDTTDLKSITQADVKKFMKIFFVPANASMTIGGNFRLDQARALVKKYFSRIPAGKRMEWKAQDKVLPPLGASSLIKQAPVEYEMLYILFATRPIGDPDEPALKMLGQFLAGASDARLKKYLLDYNPTVLDVSVTQSSQELDGTLWIVVTCKPDARLQQVYEQIMNVLGTSSRRDDITEEELRMARNLSEMQFLPPLEKFYGFGGRCDVLNLANLYTGNPLTPFLAIENQASVTGFALREMLKKYCSPDHHVVMSIVAPTRTENAVTLK